VFGAAGPAEHPALVVDALCLPPPVGAARRRPPPDPCSHASVLRADGGRWVMPMGARRGWVLGDGGIRLCRGPYGAQIVITSCRCPSLRHFLGSPCVCTSRITRHPTSMWNTPNTVRLSPSLPDEYSLVSFHRAAQSYSRNGAVCDLPNCSAHGMLHKRVATLVELHLWRSHEARNPNQAHKSSRFREI
jgi:hypothetical protein